MVRSEKSKMIANMTSNFSENEYNNNKKKIAATECFLFFSQTVRGVNKRIQKVLSEGVQL